MYTKCEHCKAVFRVGMREVTVAKGKLRCGECRKVFNAAKSLSTAIPEKFQAPEGEIKKKLTPEELQNISAMDDWQFETFESQKSKKERQDKEKREAADIKAALVMNEWDFFSKGSNSSNKNYKRINLNDESIQKPLVQAKKNKPTKTKANQKVKHTPIEKQPATKTNKLPLSIVLLLTLLLITQVIYNNRNFFSDSPKHKPEKIQMLNHNVFVHPNETGVLLISASMENTANYAQPYPILEVSLSNTKSKIISLRRFKPDEYIEDYSKNMLLPTNKATNLRLKIKDPGNNATRFQFNFL